MTRQLTAAVLTLLLTASAIADTGEGSDGWRVTTSRDEMSDVKRCIVQSQLSSYGDSSSFTNGQAELSVWYSNPPSNVDGSMAIIFVEGADQLKPFSDTVRVRFDSEPVFTTSIATHNNKGLVFVDKKLTQRARNATTMKVELDLLYNGRTVFTFSLDGSANALDQAKAECSQDEQIDAGGAWETSVSRDEMDDSKTCTARTSLVLGGNLRIAFLMVQYSSNRDASALALGFSGDQLISNAIRVRFDTKPAFTPLTVNDEAMAIFTEDSILQRVRSATTMKVELNLLHQGHTTLTFSLRGSAKAMDSAGAECSRSEQTHFRD